MMIQALVSAQPPAGKYLALGDSYTIGEAVAESERWPNQLVKALEEKNIFYQQPRIIATTGWRTDNLMEAIDAAGLKNEYALVSLLIGVNNQYQGKPLEQYKMEFTVLLNRAVQLAAGKKENVFVVSIPDYGFTPFGEAKQADISPAIDAFNEANRSITAQHGIRYVNITDISRQGLLLPAYVAPDQLHPSGAMYKKWVERLVEIF